MTKVAHHTSDYYILLVTSLSLLDALGIKRVNRSIQLCYDDEGYKYDVPIFCINEPKAFGDLTDPLMDVEFAI